MIAMAFIVLVILGYVVLVRCKYYKSSYYKATQYNFFKICFDKGFRGEYETWKNLSKYEEDGAKFIFNCYIPKGEKETTEIDVIMLHRTGIYVFESKNYSGWIFGNEKDRMWTQTLPTGSTSQKEHFYNPIRQNQAHIKWLQELLNMDDSFFYSLIVFSERCEFKSVTVNSNNAKVVKRTHVKYAVDTIAKEKGNRLSPVQIQNINHKLQMYTRVCDQEKMAHIERIKQTTYSGTNPSVIVKPNIAPQAIHKNTQTGLRCPYCGATLVLRTASKGQHAGKRFYGCSSYPKCRYIKDTGI